MTATELIALLQTFPPDLRVMVDGYEGGATDLTTQQIYTRRVALNYYDPQISYYGEHKQVEEWDDEEDIKEPIVEVLLLSRMTP